MQSNYYVERNKNNAIKLRELLKDMPKFCGDYFRSLETTKSSQTRISYCYDIKVFFEYLAYSNPIIQSKGICSITFEDLENIEPIDIEEYLSYLSLYDNSQGKTITNDNVGKARKLSSLRSFYLYYYKKGYITKDPTLLVDMPKIKDKAIIRLDQNEVQELIDIVESGKGLVGKAIKYHSKTMSRDLAIITLLLGTGLRVSECVGIDIDDIDFKNLCVKVIRKGGKETFVYFNEQVADQLICYIEESREIFMEKAVDDEKALFLSLQGNRICVKSVENLVKKYAQITTPLKKITPHKLRSTFGTTLYNNTGDIYLVAEALGHQDVNTTRKHYAAMDKDRLKDALKNLNYN